MPHATCCHGSGHAKMLAQSTGNPTGFNDFSVSSNMSAHCLRWDRAKGLASHRRITPSYPRTNPNVRPLPTPPPPRSGLLPWKTLGRTRRRAVQRSARALRASLHTWLKNRMRSWFDTQSHNHCINTIVPRPRGANPHVCQLWQCVAVPAGQEHFILYLAELNNQHPTTNVCTT